MEYKTVQFEVKEIDEEEGTFTGYAATFSKTPDSYGDIIDKGAFAKTLKERFNRIKILWNHYILEPIGKPLEMVEDDKGLLVKGKLSLGVQRAKEVMFLMKDGVITELSIGYDAMKETYEGGIRHLQEIRLWDFSPVTFAANPEAVVLSVKKATSFGNLPLADREREWDAKACERRVRAWAGGEDNINWNKYRQAFFWYDEGDPELFGSYKLGFADIISNRLTAIPRGIFAVAAVLMGARGGVAIPEAEEAGVKTHVEKYYAKMRKEFDDEEIIAPWNKSAPESTEPVQKPFNAREWLNNALEDILAQVDEEGNRIEPAKKKVNVGNLVVTIDAKSGRVLSDASLKKVRSALDALQALLAAAENEPEPAKATQLTEEVAKEAVELEGVIATLKAENEGFDTKQAEGRIEAILEQLRK